MVDQVDKCDSDTNFDLWYSNAANGSESMVMALAYWLTSGVTVTGFLFILLLSDECNEGLM